MIWLALGVLTAVATGGGLLRWILPTSDTRPAARAVRVLMAVSLGFAVQSVWYLLWLTLSGGAHRGWGFVAYDAALPIGLALRVHLTRVHSGPRQRSPSHSASNESRIIAWWSGIALVIALVAAAAILVVLAREQPYGFWDAWAKWNLKARWFALGGVEWHRVLTDPAFAATEPDYPLLLPLSVARLWTFAAATPAFVPQAVSIAGFGLTMGLVFSTTWMLRGALPACVAAVSVLAIPSFMALAAWQYADVLISALYVGALAALAVSIDSNGDRRWLLIAGLFAGAALWTKNEGLLFGAAAILATFLTAYLSKGARDASARSAWLIAGMIPFLITAAVLKVNVASNDLVDFREPGIGRLATRALDPTRHLQVLHYGWMLAKRMPDRLGLILLAVYLVSRGRGAGLGSFVVPILTLTLTALGYYGAFLITPHELPWHLDTAASRLVAQLWPGTLVTLMLVGADATSRPRAAAILPADG